MDCKLKVGLKKAEIQVCALHIERRQRSEKFSLPFPALKPGDFILYRIQRAEFH
jgi:hypothetical protein